MAIAVVSNNRNSNKFDRGLSPIPFLYYVRYEREFL